MLTSRYVHMDLPSDIFGFEEQNISPQKCNSSTALCSSRVLEERLEKSLDTTNISGSNGDA